MFTIKFADRDLELLQELAGHYPGEPDSEILMNLVRSKLFQLRLNGLNIQFAGEEFTRRRRPVVKDA